MDKKYRRTVDFHLGILIIAVIILIDVFRVPTFIWLYDGIKLVIAALAIIVSGWAVFTPYAVLTKDELRLYYSILSKRTIDIAKIDEVKPINVQHKIDIKVGNKKYIIKLTNVRKKDREAIRTDLKDAVNKSGSVSEDE